MSNGIKSVSTTASSVAINHTSAMGMANYILFFSRYRSSPRFVRSIEEKGSAVTMHRIRTVGYARHPNPLPRMMSSIGALKTRFVQTPSSEYASRLKNGKRRMERHPPQNIVHSKASNAAECIL